tara:strand:+ start:2690 stop:3529 length:840 start_codon:yes stop_codon:yes gene_type:complete
MWGRVLNGQLVEIINAPKAMMINDVQHPKTIFTKAWTDEERKAVGILPYVYSGSSKENEFYTSSFSDSVGDDAITRTFTSSAVSDLSGLKERKITDAKKYTNLMLSDTDWYIIRNAETSTAIPSEITAYRSAMRSNYAALKTAITNAADVAAVAALYSKTNSANSSGLITINGTSSDVVSTSANSITSNGHDFVVGEVLTYSNGGGADIGGLVDGTQYYVFSKTTNTFKLSHSHSNFGDAAAISLTGVASSGTSHTFTSNGIPGAGNTWPNPDASIYTV